LNVLALDRGKRAALKGLPVMSDDPGMGSDEIIPDVSVHILLQFCVVEALGALAKKLQDESAFSHVLRA